MPRKRWGSRDSRLKPREGRSSRHSMRKKLVLILITAGIFVAGFCVASFPAIAQLRVITIKLKGGQRITTTVDVPPNTPLDQIQLPEITAPIEGIEEATPNEKKRVGSSPGTNQTDGNGGQD